MQRRTRSAVAALAASSALLVGLIGTANAQDPTGPEEVNAKTTGMFSSNGSEIDLPVGSAFGGTIDWDAGSFEGQLTVPDIQAETTAEVGGNPVPVRVVLRVTDTGTDGTIDEEGNVTATSNASIQVISLAVDLAGTGSFSDLPVGDNCFMRPIEIDLTGTYDGDAGTVALTGEGFTIPEAAAGSCGAIGAIDLAEQLNGALAGSETAIELLIDLGAAPEQPIPITTTTAAPTTTVAPADPTPPPPAAAPIKGRAAYTG